eukprot:6309131-Lingulodinium_polyedra.AAC.1
MERPPETGCEQYRQFRSASTSGTGSRSGPATRQRRRGPGMPRRRKPWRMWLQPWPSGTSLEPCPD